MEDVEQLATLARARGLRVAVAESLTSGTLAGAIGEGDRASEWFAGGAVTYTIDAKERVLGLAPGTDPCSAECAEQLARGARELFDTDIAVSTTGVGGPEPEDGHPPGTVYLGWSTREETGHRQLSIDGEPERVLASTIDAAVRMLVFHAAEL